MPENSEKVFFVTEIGSDRRQQFAAILDAFASIDVSWGEGHTVMCIVEQPLANAFERSLCWLVDDHFRRSDSFPQGFVLRNKTPAASVIGSSRPV